MKKTLNTIAIACLVIVALQAIAYYVGLNIGRWSAPQPDEYRGKWITECLQWHESRYDSLRELCRRENPQSEDCIADLVYCQANTLGWGKCRITFGDDGYWDTEFFVFTNSDGLVQMLINYDISSELPLLEELRASGLTTGWTEVPKTLYARNFDGYLPALWIGLSNEPYMNVVAPDRRATVEWAMSKLDRLSFMEGFWVYEIFPS